MKPEIENAIDILQRELKYQLDKIKTDIISASNSGAYNNVKKFAEEAKELEELNKSLSGIKVKWSKLPQSKKIEKEYHKDGRTHRGERTPQIDYRIPILTILKQMGGKGETKEIIDKIFPLLKNKLTKIDLENVPSREEPRWRNVAMWERNTMVEVGLLSKNSPKGIWEITQAGYKYLEKNS